MIDIITLHHMTEPGTLIGGAWTHKLCCVSLINCLQLRARLQYCGDSVDNGGHGVQTD